MRLLTVYFLISLAIRAYTAFNPLYEPVKKTFLIFSCPRAYGALEALFGHLPVFFSNGVGIHYYCNLKMIGNR